MKKTESRVKESVVKAVIGVADHFSNAESICSTPLLSYEVEVPEELKAQED